MKVLFIAESHGVHTVKWVNALAQRGHDVHLLSRIPDQMTKQSIDERVTVHYLKQRKRLQSILSFAEVRGIWKKLKPDITNTHYVSSYGISACLAGIHPNILSVWGSDVYTNPYENALVMRLIRRALRKADIVTSSSNIMAKQTQKIALKDIPVEVIPFGVDTALFSPGEKDSDNDILTIGIVKTLKPVYSIETLLEAFAIVKKDTPVPIRLAVYGKGPLQPDLERLAKELEIDEETTFYGEIPNTDVPKALRDIDIFALTSISESFGVAAIEAMACACPVVATDAEGFCEVISDNETGFIVPAKNPQEFAKKLKVLIEDKELRGKMGKSGRERVINYYDWEKNVLQMEELYQRMKK